MKRSEINTAFEQASSCFNNNSWQLPPNPKWDITDFGLQNFESFGLVLVNLAQEAEYCEKLMYARKNQETPLHYHKTKKEDIICRSGELTVVMWQPNYDVNNPRKINVKKNGDSLSYIEGETLVLAAGERITIAPFMWHRFFPSSTECIIGEVSTANDDANDNFFDNKDVGRYPEIEEDAVATVRLISEKAANL